LAKGKKRWRLIYLTARAEEIVSRLASRYVKGPVFRNVRGNPWSAQAFNCRFFRVQKKLGVKYALTSLRHSFGTRLVEAGVDLMLRAE
jgi:site-specific recombinase XerD